MNEDQALLLRYASEGDQEAFAQLVQRHVHLVYGTALRLVTDASLAEDITQSIFCKVARQARTLARHPALAGWLYMDTRNAARQLLRSEWRRKAREQKAVAMQPLETGGEPDWAQLRPLLDAALETLNRLDREALLLRFLEQRSLREVGLTLGMGEDATRMRISRALEKLRLLFSKRGISTTSTALAGALAACSAFTAPTTLAGSVLASALAAGAANAAPSVIAPITTYLMINTKTVLIGSLLAMGVATPLFWQYRVQQAWQHQNQIFEQQIAELQSTHEEQQQQMKQFNLHAARILELDAEVTRLRQQLARWQKDPNASGVVQNKTSSSSALEAQPEVKPITDSEIIAFLQRPPIEQGLFLGGLRVQSLTNGFRPTAEWVHNRELAEKIRPSLETLESKPAEYAAFQSSFIKAALNLQDNGKVAQIQDIIQKACETAVSSQLDAASRPQRDVEAWGKRRDALDRQATHTVQQLLTPEERQIFDRAFLGVIGIDLGVGDGGWHRFVQPDGTVIFPSEQTSANADKWGP